MRGPSLVLYRPQIPPNTGNIARLSMATNSRLLIVGKAAFDISHKAAQRAGLDYWQQVNLSLYPQFKSFYQNEVQQKSSRMVAISKEGKTSLFDFRFSAHDLLIFGNETAGLPPKFLKLCPESVRIPMWQNNRSLNLSNAAAVTSYFYMAQLFDKETLDNETLAMRNYFLKKDKSLSTTGEKAK